MLGVRLEMNEENNSGGGSDWVGLGGGGVRVDWSEELKFL